MTIYLSNVRQKLLHLFLSTIFIFTIIYFIGTALARPAQDHPFFEQFSVKPLVIAHGGSAGHRPTNTLPAFEHAVELGADMLEMDIHGSLDGALVIIHDDTVDRTTNGSGFVKEMTWAELKELDAGYHFSTDGGESYPYRGQGVQLSTVEEVFEKFPTMPMTIELKQVEPSIADNLCMLIRKYDMGSVVLVASFRKEAMDEFRIQCPEVATSAVEEEVRRFFYLHLARLGNMYSPDTNALQIPESAAGFELVNDRFLRTATKKNLQIHVWTINESDDMERLIKMGVDGLITDYPDRALNLLGR